MNNQSNFLLILGKCRKEVPKQVMKKYCRNGYYTALNVPSIRVVQPNTTDSDSLETTAEEDEVLEETYTSAHPMMEPKGEEVKLL